MLFYDYCEFKRAYLKLGGAGEANVCNTGRIHSADISESPNWVAVGLLKIQNVSAKRNILVKDKQTMQHSDFRSTQPFTVSVCVSVFVHVPHTGIVTSLAKLVPVCRAQTTALCAYFPLKGPSMYNRVCNFCHMLCYSSCFSKLFKKNNFHFIVVHMESDKFRFSKAVTKPPYTGSIQMACY